MNMNFDIDPGLTQTLNSKTRGEYHTNIDDYELWYWFRVNPDTVNSKTQGKYHTNIDEYERWYWSRVNPDS